MAKCPQCGGPGGVMLFTSVAPCERCYNPQKYAASAAKLYDERRAPSVITGTRKPLPSHPGVDPASWHMWTHPSGGWRLWTMNDSRLTTYGYSAVWPVYYTVVTRQPELCTKAGRAWIPLSNSVRELQQGMVADLINNFMGGRYPDLLGYALK